MLIQQGRNFLTHGYELLSLRLTWFGVEPIFQCPHVVVHGESLLRSDTPYHTPAGISTSNIESYQFRHIFIFDWVDGPSLCRHWCNPQSLIAASHNGIFNADGFGPASSFLVYCGADFAWRVSLCTALFSPLGAGVAGVTPRRVRTAYSRTRCLPHPKGWAYTPTGRFCAALTYCSYYTFPRTSCLSALRADVDEIYPARKSNACVVLCFGHFAERKRF